MGFSVLKVHYGWVFLREKFVSKYDFSTSQVVKSYRFRSVFIPALQNNGASHSSVGFRKTQTVCPHDLDAKFRCRGYLPIWKLPHQRVLEFEKWVGNSQLSYQSTRFSFGWSCWFYRFFFPIWIQNWDLERSILYIRCIYLYIIKKNRPLTALTQQSCVGPHESKCNEG